MIPFGHLNNPPWKSDILLGNFIKQLSDRGINSRFVGGIVRDAILQRFKPNYDFDIAVDVSPDEMIAACLEMGVQVIPTGLPYGTVTCVVGEKSYEVTSLRKDISTDGRKAIVKYTKDWKADAKRRDFTINALYADWDGTYYDPTRQGLEDLDGHYLRFIGEPEQRIKEDFLRIVRFFRFMALFEDYKYDEKAYNTCMYMGKYLKSISSERKWNEIQKIFQSPYPLNAIEQLISSKLMLEICRINWSLNKLERSLPWFQNRFNEIFYGILGAVNYFKLDRTICIPLNLQKRLDEVLKVDFPAPYNLKALYFAGRSTYKDAYIRHTIITDVYSDETLKKCNEQLLKIETEIIPKFPVSGADLQDLGFLPGPVMGDILKQTEKWWVEKDFVPDFDACLHHIQTLHLSALKDNI